MVGDGNPVLSPRGRFQVQSCQCLTHWYSSGDPAWRLAPLMVNAGTGWPGGSVLPLGEMASLSCHFCLSVAAHSIVEAYLSLIHASRLSGR